MEKREELQQVPYLMTNEHFKKYFDFGDDRATQGYPSGEGKLDKPFDPHRIYVIARLQWPDFAVPIEELFFEALSPWCNSNKTSEANAEDNDDWSFSLKFGYGHIIYRFVCELTAFGFIRANRFLMFDPKWMRDHGGHPYSHKGYEHMPLFMDRDGCVWCYTSFRLQSLVPVFHEKDKREDRLKTMDHVIRHNYSSVGFCYQKIYDNLSDGNPEHRLYTHKRLEQFCLEAFREDKSFSEEELKREYRFRKSASSGSLWFERATQLAEAERKGEAIDWEKLKDLVEERNKNNEHETI
jgi:hypothetical protein